MKYKVVKSRNKKEENENPFDIQYFRTKFKVLNKRGHEKSTILSMKRSISHSKRSSAIEKDLQSIKNNNLFVDHRHQAESLKACPELLTHGGLRLEEINIHENHIKFHHKAHQPMQHFGGLFDDAEPEITQSTKELLDQAALKIQDQKDVEKELNAAFDDLEAKWGSIKDELFKNKIKCENKVEDDYHTLLAVFKESALVQSVSNVKKHETTLRNEEILFNPLSADRLFSSNLYFISHPNQKIEDDIEGLSEIKKPRFFIDISEYINKMTASYDSFNGDAFDVVSQDDVYIAEKWGQKFLMLNKEQKKIEFGKFIKYFINSSITISDFQMIFENFALVLKCDPVYLQQTFKMMLLYFVLNRPLKSINHNKVSFVLYLIAKLCTISSISNPLFEAAFQICVYFVSSTEISPALTLRYCGIIYEFCCKNQLYCPEIIDSFTRLVKSQTNDAVFLLNLFKIILAFIDIWKDLCHIKKVITLITPIIRISDISDCEEFSHISKKIHEMIQTGSKKRFDNNFLIKKVKTIHQYDPIIKEIKPQSDKSNKITLLKKIKKREHKGAVRELRKDSEYCAARQLRETIKNDEERMKKVKQLYKDISMEKCN